jgi:hypothetical protein
MKVTADRIAKEFNQLSGGDYQTALLYAALTGAVVSEVLPTPATAWAYFRMKVLQKQKADGKITQEELEQKIGEAYAYALPIWWIVVFGAIHFHKGNFNEKAKLALALVGGGAVVGAFFKNYVKNLPKYQIE